MKTVYGFKIPLDVLDKISLEKRSKIFDKGFTCEYSTGVAGLEFQPTSDKYICLTDEYMNNMNTFANDKIKQMEMMKQVEKLLGEWNKIIKAYHVNLKDTHNSEEIESIIEPLNYPDHLEFNWFILED